MHVTGPCHHTLVASTVLSLAAIAIALLYVDPWGVPRIAAGILIGSLVVAVTAGKFLKYRPTSGDPDGLPGLRPRPAGRRPGELFAEPARHP